VIEKEFSQYIQKIRQRIEVLYRHIISSPIQQQQFLAEGMEDMAAFIDNLQLQEEQMQASLEAMEVIQEELLEQNEYLAEQRQRYYDLFEFAPDAYLLTDPQGIILEANRAAAALFNIWQNFLIGKPLIYFVHEAERSVIRTKINQLSEKYSSVHEWEVRMCPRFSQPFDASLLVAPLREYSGALVYLRIAVRDVTKYKRGNLQELESAARQLLPLAAAAIEVPPSLDGLQVLVVDDEADAREFITAVLESHGIRVIAVATAAEALEALERFRPDVLVSDIRMPDEDGYSLIRKVRELEAKKGWHVPAAALTAYLEESREKALSAGFEAHLHKLAEPNEWIEMVAQLAERRNS
jgi:PAS domain S-box-containing protein